MTYADEDVSIEAGRPFYLYQFIQGEAVWRFTSRASDWISLDLEANEITWTASAIAHGDVVQSSEILRATLDVIFPLSDAFARRFLGPPSGGGVVTLTIFRGHEAVPEETVAHWKGRVLGGSSEGRRITLSCEPVMSTMRRAGVRAKYQGLCRHVLYRGGCRLDLGDHLVTAEATGVAGLVVTVPAAAGAVDGWYSAGILTFAGQHAFIVEHVGAELRLAGPLSDLAAAVADEEIETVEVGIAPGCDLRDVTCEAKFDNLLNFGGFPDIPGRNPFGGGSVV